jgi:RND family efflux transporter MFP subunit
MGTTFLRADTSLPGLGSLMTIKHTTTLNFNWALAGFLAAALLGASSCSNSSSAVRTPSPPVVEVALVEQKDVPIYSEWIGTLDGMFNADIKAQVTGYLLKQDYTEGTFVSKGQLLFEIDPRPFQAALDQALGQLAAANGQRSQAQAQLAQAQAQVLVAEANQTRAQLDENRYVPLMQQQAITQQDLDNATQTNLAAKAQVQVARATVETARAQIEVATAAVGSAKAAVDTAQVNLEFTKLVAPIEGIAGQALQQVGALVSPASGPVTAVSTVDPIKAYFTVSEQEYLDFHRRFPDQTTLDAERKQLRFELILGDGLVYQHIGSFFFADREVSQSTGAIRAAALFPNPGNILRPGVYGKVRASIRTQLGALLVPQRAVNELQGSYQVAVVDSENMVSIRTVTVGDRVGSLWIVTSGLKAGERVIVEGVQSVRPGLTVTAKPYSKKES